MEPIQDLITRMKQPAERAVYIPRSDVRRIIEHYEGTIERIHTTLRQMATDPAQITLL